MIIVGLLLAHLLVWIGRANLAVWVSVGVMLVIFMYAVATTVSTLAPIALILPLVAAGMLLSRRGAFVVALLIGFTLIARAVNQGQSFGTIRYVPGDNAVPEFVAYVIFFGLAAAFMLLFSGSGERLITTALKDISQFKAADKFNRTITANDDENAVLRHLIETIQNELGYSLAQIYLPGADGEYARRMRLGLAQAAHVALRGERALDQRSDPHAPADHGEHPQCASEQRASRPPCH